MRSLTRKQSRLLLVAVFWLCCAAATKPIAFGHSQSIKTAEHFPSAKLAAPQASLVQADKRRLSRGTSSGTGGRSEAEVPVETDAGEMRSSFEQYKVSCRANCCRIQSQDGAVQLLRWLTISLAR